MSQITQDPERNQNFSLDTPLLYFQFARNLVDQHTIELLTKYLTSIGFSEKKEELFGGAKLNLTENETVTHTLLREEAHFLPLTGGEDERALTIRAELEKMERFTESIYAGQRKGATGKKINSIVNIGIGGSELGPNMVAHALSRFSPPHPPKVFFLSSPDTTHFNEIISQIDLEETLFLVTTKSFSTKETLFLAAKVRKLYEKSGMGEEANRRHFIAITAKPQEAAKWGVLPENTFFIPPGVGGRFSLWSAAGLSIALAIGFDNFRKLLQGAHQMDLHFRNSPAPQNIPVILALLSYWNNNYLGNHNHFVTPYSYELRDLPSYLQQLELESNGKSVSIGGEFLNYPTVPILLGGLGPNSQHSCFQLLHQGSSVVPTDFIGVIEDGDSEEEDFARVKLSNLLAQAEGLCRGRDAQHARVILEESGASEEKISELVNHRVFPGNRPSNIILLKEYSPESVGALLAMYEHKVFTQGVLWNINSFDQWGVELGKEISGQIEKAMLQRGKVSAPPAKDSGDCVTDDCVTKEIIDKIFEKRK